MSIIKLKKMKKMFALFMSSMLMMQTATINGDSSIYAATTTATTYSSQSIPNELKYISQKKEIPLYHHGLIANQFSEYLRKYDGDTSYATGIATFRAKAYAYKDSSGYKVGIDIEMLNTNKTWEDFKWVADAGCFTASDIKGFIEGKKDLDIKIDNTTFSALNSDYYNLKIKFQMKSYINNSDTAYKSFEINTDKGVKFACTSDWYTPSAPLEIAAGVAKPTRTVKGVENTKNVWDVEVMLEGEVTMVNAPTDVVLVLERAGSMAAPANGTTRGAMVKNSALDLVDSLLSEYNVNVSVVSFGEFKRSQDGQVPSNGFEYYDDGWNPKRLTASTSSTGRWAQRVVEVGFTKDRYKLKTAVLEAMDSENLYGGSPTSLGIIEAGKMLETSKATNKIMILVSDGAASFARDGTGEGSVNEQDPTTWQYYISSDTEIASKQAHERIDNLQFYTVATGDKMHQESRDIINGCATVGEDYAHNTLDTQESIDAAFDQIFKNIKKNIIGQTIVEEEMNSNIIIQSPTESLEDSIAKVSNLGQIDWEKTSIAVTQGNIYRVGNRNIAWNVGEIKAGVPAVMKYRIHLESGNIGETYWMSKTSRFKYRDRQNNLMDKAIPDYGVRLYWAEIDFETGYEGTDAILPGSEMKMWYQVPAPLSFKSDSMPFGYNIKSDEAKLEIGTFNSAKPLKEVITLPTNIEATEKHVQRAIVNGVNKTFEEMDQQKLYITKSPNKVTTVLKQVQEVDISKTVTEVEGEKNVWEVEMQVTGQNKIGSQTTDIVLVLDRSGSMNAMDDNQVRRGEKVQEAAKDLVDKLLTLSNVNIGAVSFGGFKVGGNPNGYISGPDGYIPAEGLPYFDKDWNTFLLSPSKKEGNDWAQYTIDCELTRNKDELKHGIDKALYFRNLYGGTAISQGIIQGGKILQNSKGNNKVMILISDGAPTYARDGSGPTRGFQEGNPDTWDPVVVNDTISASREAHEKIKGLKLFTLTVGENISEAGKALLADCATDSEKYAYNTDDTMESIRGVMDEIADDVIDEISTEATVIETMIPNLGIKSPVEDVSSVIKQLGFTDETATITNSVDWDTTSLAVTQGSIEELTNNSFVWNVGTVEYMKPAVLKYRIHMQEGVLGKEYDVSEESKLEYIDLDSTLSTKYAPNTQISLSWAEMNLSTYDYESNRTVPGSEMTLWYEVPEGFRPGDMKFNHNLKYDVNTNEISSTGTKTIGSSIKLPSGTDGTAAIIEGVMIDDEMYSIEDVTGSVGTSGVNLINTPTKMVSLVSEPEISSESNKDNNFIQPEGVSNVAATIKFGTSSKDVKYIVDISNMVNAKLNGFNLMNYNIAGNKVEIRKVNEGNKVLTEGRNYTVTKVGNNIEVSFKDSINAGDEFKVDIYIPTRFGENVVY